MIFEKLQYVIECFENERLIMERASDRLAKQDSAQITQCEQNHNKQMQELRKRIAQLKQLYVKKLPIYEQ